MKKTLILCAVVATLAVGGTAVYAQVNGSGQAVQHNGERAVKYSREEVKYYSDIIIGVEAGKLPRSDIHKAREFLLNRADIYPELIERYGIQ
ncbi:hypothetical protein DFQ01_10588 [Paenibacillus cellulosilyticus]|uniref:DUF4148 domain-containing protein n=1 Tax=Paenibacillus cellulosilyticus TaxID=375489 RepID=A0A2V2Z450_9BACL|nr:hypothetical protein [Paenibacillus cellulosilyticus]PWW05105.1 hypothetical protein DFQ01_10588 [Paenibacillus cellulosilyticus]QKS48656.1 hypothetical protein HUB94_31110 [Paenibacillus cellulosilyticus]